MAAERRKRRLEAESEPSPLSRPNQLKWGFAFFSLLGATLIFSSSAISLLNALTTGPTAISRASRTLSLRWPAAPLPPIQTSLTPIAAALHWGVWRGAHSFSSIPIPCLEAMAGVVEPFVDAPAVARVALLGWGLRGGGGGGGGVDAFHLLPFFRGWLEVGWRGLYLVLQDDNGLAQGGMITFSLFMISVVVLLFGIEAWHTQIRPWCLRREKRRSDARVKKGREATAKGRE